VNIELLTLILFASLFLLLATGFPISFAAGAVAVVFAIALWGTDHLSIIGSAAYSSLTNVNLVAIPLFIFLGWVFRFSGIGDDLFETVYIWLGRIPGGLAMGCLMISVLLGAICGDLAATIFMLATIVLPAMLKRGYDKYLATGCVMVGGLLGIIVPPSIETIVYCTTIGESVGKMYLATFVPALIMASMYILYIGIRCRLNPKLGPPAYPERKIDWGARITSLKSIALPMLLILFIMGGIYGGVMSPLEASSVGAVGALVVAAVYRRLNWQILKDSVYNTFTVSGFLVWILMGVGCFTSVYQGIGAPDLAVQVAKAIPGGGWGTIAVMQVSLVGLGTVMDDWAIILIFGPIFVSVVKTLGFSALWYGAAFLVNMQIALLTPPYGFALFIMRAAAPNEYNITMLDIYRSALPFIGAAVLSLIIVLAFPVLTTFLPNLIIGG
jgi:tripartite ATP-independent transporter DctM subunit